MRMPLVVLVSAALFSTACASRQAQSVVPALDPEEPKVKALAEFARNVDAYVRVHRTAASSVAPLRTGTGAEEISTRQRALAEAIRGRRSTAQRGDIFSPTVTPVIVGIVQRYLTSPEGAVSRESLGRENPGAETPTTSVPFVVNGAYEAGVSLSTVPSPLLMKLPALPQEVEFRFVGKHLVLRDTSANIIADYVLNVAP